MKLITKLVNNNQWIVISDAVADPSNLNPYMVTIGEKQYGAFVDNNNLRLRCPSDIEKGEHSVKVNDQSVGTVQVA